MASQEEVVLAVLGAVASVLYFAVAAIQVRRQVGPNARGALNGFIIWWAGLGALGLVTLFFTFGPDITSYGVGGVRAIIYTLFAGIFVMLAGLVYYLAYLYTGSRKTLWGAVVFYALLFVYMVWLVEAHGPHLGPGHPGTEQADESFVFHLHDEPSAAASAVLSLGLILPPLAAAIAYALLFFRTTDRTSRYRIGMVSTGFVLWFLYSTIGTLARLATGSTQGFTSQLIGQFMGVLAATLTLLAYEPPPWIRRMLALRDIAGDPQRVLEKLKP